MSEISVEAHDGKGWQKPCSRNGNIKKGVEKERSLKNDRFLLYKDL